MTFEQLDYSGAMYSKRTTTKEKTKFEITDADLIAANRILDRRALDEEYREFDLTAEYGPRVNDQQSITPTT